MKVLPVWEQESGNKLRRRNVVIPAHTFHVNTKLVEGVCLNVCTHSQLLYDTAIYMVNTRLYIEAKDSQTNVMDRR